MIITQLALTFALMEMEMVLLPWLPKIWVANGISDQLRMDLDLEHQSL